MGLFCLFQIVFILILFFLEHTSQNTPPKKSISPTLLQARKTGRKLAFVKPQLLLDWVIRVYAKSASSILVFIYLPANVLKSNNDADADDDSRTAITTNNNHDKFRITE